MKTFASCSAILLLVVGLGYWHYGDVLMAVGSWALAGLFAAMWIEVVIMERKLK